MNKEQKAKLYISLIETEDTILLIIAYKLFNEKIPEYVDRYELIKHIARKLIVNFNLLADEQLIDKTDKNIILKRIK